MMPARFLDLRSGGLPEEAFTMISLRSFLSVPVALLVASTVAGCGNDPPKPDPSAATSATATGSAKGRLNLRTPLAPTVKVDPLATKDYRVDVCYFGTLTLKQARDAYMASLGGAEPSEKKIPNFGGITTPGAAPSGAPAASGAPTAKPATPGAPATTAPKPATPAVSGAPTAKPATTAAPAVTNSAAPGASASSSSAARPPLMPGADPARRPFDVALRAPHERNARACSVAAGLKDAPMGDVDAALAIFAPFAVDLAKQIAAATTYYQREEYKKDEFKKGKELHKQLVEGFQKLDEQSEKVGAAVDAWHKAHPADAAKMEEGEKLANASWNDARDLMLAVAAKKPNVQGFKDATGKLEKSLEALKNYAQSHPTDPWGKMMNPSLESMLKTAKDYEAKVTEKGVDGDSFLVFTNSYVAVIEARYRALSRATTMKAQPPATAGAAAAPAPDAPKPE